jgi:hypothetical protein
MQFYSWEMLISEISEEFSMKTSAECNEDSYLAILHLSRVELHCKLQEIAPCNMALSQKQIF